MTGNKAWDQYHDYLDLDKIIGAQHPKSDAAGDPQHDEMLFIQFHQIYELWFKQILFELDDIQNRFSGAVVDDRDMEPIVSYLGRIVEILKQMTSMIDVLQTMPPQSFTDFRQYLGTASGFQSWQFRLIETRLGLRRADRIPVFHGQYDDHLRPESQKAMQAAEKFPSLYDQVDSWLARTPFVDMGHYKFWDDYRTAVHNMFGEREKLVRLSLTGEALDKELAAMAKGREKFDGIFDPAKHEKARENGQWRMSWKALQAALFISIYRENPMLQAPFKVLNALKDVDELLAQWRFRHALMVQRMVGMSMGTGGSSGYEYLMRTVSDHRIFSDLFAMATYLIPSNVRPDLPQDVIREMSYKHSLAGDKNEPGPQP